MTEDQQTAPALSIPPEEIAIIEKCVSDGDVVFDVSAAHGAWADNLRRLRTCDLHLFEPAAGDALNHISIGGEGGPAAEAPAISLDAYWPKENGLIHLLKIDVEAAAYDVLRGGNDLLRRGGVDYIQFAYGAGFAEAGISLKLLYFYLRRMRYHLFRAHEGGFEEIADFDEGLEDFERKTLLAVNERLLSRFKGQKAKINLYFDALEEIGVSINGVVHIGAHEGREVAEYRARGVNPIIMIEANPKYAGQLKARHGDDPDVTIIEGAVSDRAGKITFNIASHDQSSSILPLKTHAKLYPRIRYKEEIEVDTFTLDASLTDFRAKNPDAPIANMIVMDIQGAELMALRGGAASLAHVDAIQLEVNYDELYEGCPIIWELDDFLSGHGFVRYKTVTPYSRDWGDALYIRRPVVALGASGAEEAFGDQFFRHAFLRCHASDMDYRAEAAPWAGDLIFDLGPGVPGAGAGLRKIAQGTDRMADCAILNGADRLANAEIRGAFLYDGAVFRRHRRMLQKAFAFKGPYAARADHIAATFWRRYGPVVALHLEEADQAAWCADWLQALRAEHPALTLYLASDAAMRGAAGFAGIETLCAADFDPDGRMNPRSFDDFAALVLCDKALISDSASAFAATMLNRRADQFMRLDPATKTPIPYDPWSASPQAKGGGA